MLKTFSGPTIRSKRVALVDNLTAQASASRHPLPLSFRPAQVHSYSNWSSLRKGKQREDCSGIYLSGYENVNRRAGPAHLTVRIQQCQFHSTRPRLAVPLIPAGFAILKVRHDLHTVPYSLLTL